jgi:CBS domain-containing protein
VASATDLLKFPADRKAWQLCSYKPISVEANTPVGEVAQLMVHHRIHHAVVMNASGMVGVVSSLDFVRLFVPETAR